MLNLSRTAGRQRTAIRIAPLTQVLALDGARVKRNHQVVAGLAQLGHRHRRRTLDHAVLVVVLEDTKIFVTF